MLLLQNPENFRRRVNFKPVVPPPDSRAQSSYPPLAKSAISILCSALSAPDGDRQERHCERQHPGSAAVEAIQVPQLRSLFDSARAAAGQEARVPAASGGGGGRGRPSLAPGEEEGHCGAAVGGRRPGVPSGQEAPVCAASAVGFGHLVLRPCQESRLRAAASGGCRRFGSGVPIGQEPRSRAAAPNGSRCSGPGHGVCSVQEARPFAAAPVRRRWFGPGVPTNQQARDAAFAVFIVGVRWCSPRRRKTDVKPQGSNKDGFAAINPRLANGAEGGVSGKEFKKSEKLINAKEIKGSMPMKPGRPRSPNKTKDPEKKACMVPDVRQCRVEVCKKAIEANDAKQASRKEETRKVADEVAREPEQETVEDDDGVLCAVCRSTDGDPADPIVFCDGCDLMVHASCYGSPLAQSIPDGDWFCSLCSAKKSKAAARPSCSCRRSSSGTPTAATTSTAPAFPPIDSPRSATYARAATVARSSAPSPSAAAASMFLVALTAACASSTVRGRAASSSPASAGSTPSSGRR
jgi:hypothetical protein